MDAITLTLLTLYVVNGLLGAYLAILWKAESAKLTPLILLGSFIYLNLPAYIRQDKLKTFRALSCSAFMLLVATIVNATINWIK